MFLYFFFLLLRRPPRSTLFPYTRSSDLQTAPPHAEPASRRATAHTSAVTPLPQQLLDRKSTRLNSSHVAISYAVFCLKKKKKKQSPSGPRNYIPETSQAHNQYLPSITVH